MEFGIPRSIQKYHDRRVTAWCLMLLIVVGGVFFSGCRISRENAVRKAAQFVSFGRPIVQVEPVRRSKKNAISKWFSNVPEPLSERTTQLLRRYDLERQYRDDPDAVIKQLEQLVNNRPIMEEIHGLAEIAKIQANFAADNGDVERAMRLHATAVVHAYQFLFDPKLDLARNAYDPQFRSICDVYNRSLGELLREVCKSGEMKADSSIRVGTAAQGIEFVVRMEGRWHDQEFERFELVNDFQASGIDNRHHRYGLGVPLIAVRKKQEASQPYEKYYPPDLTMPMTAFIHFLPPRMDSNSGPRENYHRAELMLYDPLERAQVRAESMVVPLESDFTTPLAYALNDPLLNKGILATVSLLDPNYVPESHGLFMLEPYDPKKIPVVMSHGLWSTPAMWVHMFNDLRANREIHQNYQFWFYSYPTGQPFWISAQQMRRDLAEVRQQLDPFHQSESLNQMVLVGHSMGGLISLLQTVDSSDHFWRLISDHPIDALEGEPAAIESLRSTFFFQPNPGVDRVITIATPLRGSEFANRATRWVGQRLIQLPDIVTRDFKQIASRNKNKLKNDMLVTTTSVDSLAPGNPVFEAIAISDQLDGVKTNNIIGRVPNKFRLTSTSQDDEYAGDGVVSVESALNHNAESQVYIPEEHTRLPQHPSCIYEVQRVLLKNLVDIGRIRGREYYIEPRIQQATLLQPLVDTIR